jgi:hypothetical protein
MSKIGSVLLSLPSATMTLVSVLAFAATGCATSDESTGSESHFVRCKTDKDCDVGTCEMGYCELNGRRLTEESILAQPSGNTPAGGDPSMNCLEVSTTPTTLEDVGLTAPDLNLGPTSATLTWDGSGWGSDLHIDPESGSSEITVRLMVDETSAERIEREPNPNRGGDLGLCETLTQVEMQYRITTADGSLDELGKTTHRFASGAVPQSLTLRLKANALDGTLTIQPGDEAASAELDIGLWWPGEEFSGNLSLLLNQPMSDGSTSSGAQGRFGAFSATGCAVQEYLAGADSRFGQNTVTEEVALAEQPQTFEGQWSDTGQAATLTVKPSVNPGPVCHTETEMLMSGTVTVASDDGRVDGLELDGTRRLWLPSGSDTVGERGWTAGAQLDCAATDPWPFATPSCVTGRQGVSVSLSDRLYDVLELYVFDSNPVSEGPADSLVSFSTTP